MEGTKKRVEDRPDLKAKVEQFAKSEGLESNVWMKKLLLKFVIWLDSL